MADSFSLNLGHNHPAVLEALRKVETVPVMAMFFGEICRSSAPNLVQIAPSGLGLLVLQFGTEGCGRFLKLAVSIRVKILFTPWAVFMVNLWVHFL